MIVKFTAKKKRERTLMSQSEEVTFTPQQLQVDINILLSPKFIIYIFNFKMNQFF